MLTRSTKAEPATLPSITQQLMRCHMHPRWDPNPRSEVPAFIDTNSCSIIRGIQGSISSYRASAQTKQYKARLGIIQHLFPLSKQNPDLTEYYYVKIIYLHSVGSTEYLCLLCTPECEPLNTLVLCYRKKKRTGPKPKAAEEGKY